MLTLRRDPLRRFGSGAAAVALLLFAAAAGAQTNS